MLNFPENEGDSRELKKVQELVPHFQEQCRHYAPKQNITYSIDEIRDWLIMKRRREERRRKTVVCKNLEQTSTKCGV